MKNHLSTLLSLLFCAHFAVESAFAGPLNKIEQAGCQVVAASSSTVMVSCPETVLEEESAQPAELKKCDPVKGKPATVTLERKNGESDGQLLDRLGNAWDEQVAQQCKATSQQKCSFFRGEGNKDKGSCVFDRFEAVEVTTVMAPDKGVVTATPQCLYECKACSTDAPVAASSRSAAPR